MGRLAARERAARRPLGVAARDPDAPAALIAFDFRELTIGIARLSRCFILTGMPTMSQIIARRVGRIAFGVVLLAGVAWLATAAWVGSFDPHRGPRLDAAWIVGLTWLAAIAAGGTARGLAARGRWSRGADTLFAKSVVIPTLGVALLLPITMHLPVVVLVADVEAFDFWVIASLWITSLAHLVFAATCALRGYRLVAGKPAMSPTGIYVATLLTSCVPFVVLWAIPPALVAITALPFIPMLHALERRIARERLEFETVSQALPRAVALPLHSRK
jgi:hypothetical protein